MVRPIIGESVQNRRMKLIERETERQRDGEADCDRDRETETEREGGKVRKNTQGNSEYLRTNSSV